MYGISRSAVKVGIARVDLAEVGEKRYQTAVLLVNAVPRPVSIGHDIPSHDVTRPDILWLRFHLVSIAILVPGNAVMHSA